MSEKFPVLIFTKRRGVYLRRVSYWAPF